MLHIDLIGSKVNIKRFSLVSMRSCIELRNVVSLSSLYLTIHTTIDAIDVNNTIHTIHAIDVDNTVVDTTVVIV